MQPRPVLLAALLASACADPASSPTPTPPDEVDVAGEKGDHKADGNANGLPYTSATSIEALKGDLRGISPPVDRVFVGDPLSPKAYLQVMSCLGYYGPIGPYGPLGLLGPVGEDVWNPSRYISGSLDWHLFSQELSESDGSLSAEGPLGSKGPLNPSSWAAFGVPDGESDAGSRTYSNAFIGQLRPAASSRCWARWAPRPAGRPRPPRSGGRPRLRGRSGGPLRRRGGRGPDGGSICRTVEVPWEEGGEVRTYELPSTTPPTWPRTWPTTTRRSWPRARSPTRTTPPSRSPSPRRTPSG
ncbi:MAG: hypothetical protein R3F43_05760 [bacterium]